MFPGHVTPTPHNSSWPVYGDLEDGDDYFGDESRVFDDEPANSPLNRASELPASFITGTHHRPRQLRILVVEDCDAVRRGFVRLLQTLGVAIGADSAADALHIVKANPQFDAILCDLNMPGGDGLFFREQMQIIAPELAQRIVICTASRDDNLATLLNLSEAHILRKPVQPAALLRAMRTLGHANLTANT